MFVHQWYLYLGIGRATRICEAEIAFCTNGLTVKIPVLQGVDQGRRVFEFAIDASEAGFAVGLDGVARTCQSY